MRRAALRGWSTPLLAAPLNVFIAARKACCDAAPSLPAKASRACFTADFTWVRTDWLRARRTVFCRLRFSADFVLATSTPGKEKLLLEATKGALPTGRWRGRQAVPPSVRL